MSQVSIQSCKLLQYTQPNNSFMIRHTVTHFDSLRSNSLPAQLEADANTEKHIQISHLHFCIAR